MSLVPDMTKRDPTVRVEVCGVLVLADIKNLQGLWCVPQFLQSKGLNAILDILAVPIIIGRKK